MTKTSSPRIQMVVNRDSFFLSHRLHLARAARDAGMEVIVTAGDSGNGERRAIEAEGFEFIPLPVARGKLNPFAEARTFGSLLRLYQRLRPTLIHHSTVQPVIYGSIAARLVDGAAVVNTISGLGYAFTSEQRTAKALRPVLRRLWSIALSHPRSRTIFQNADDRDDFIRMRLVRANAAALIRGSGVDCALFAQVPEPAGIPIVALPARMLWDKGVAEFVAAARQLRASGLAARFVLIGAPDPGNREAIPVEQLEAWARDGTVEWWGPREGRDMPKVLAETSIVVLPTYGEGLPKVLLEAGAVGRPVIATAVRGCREVVRDGVNGFLVPPRDSEALARGIECLVTAPELRARLGAGGRRVAETEFAEPLVVEQTLALYHQLLAARQN